MKHSAIEIGLTPVSAPMRVSALDMHDAAAVERWDSFVMSCPEATFFHRAGWQHVIGNVFGHATYYLYATRGGALEGVLPLAHVRSRLFGNALVSLPFAVYGGTASVSDEAATALEDAAQSLAQRLGVDHLEFRNRSARHPDWPTQELYCTFRKAILPDVEANMLAIPRKQRAMVRKGIGHGLSSAIDDGCHRLFALYADNVRRHGTPALAASILRDAAAGFRPGL